MKIPPKTSPAMPLNDRQIKNAKPAEKPFKLNDGKGLYLYINTNGGKLWRFDFSHNVKRKTLLIGKYPTVSPAAVFFTE